MQIINKILTIWFRQNIFFIHKNVLETQKLTFVGLLVALLGQHLIEPPLDVRTARMSL